MPDGVRLDFAPDLITTHQLLDLVGLGVSRIALIESARRAGFRLEEIRDLLRTRIDGEPPGDEWRALVEIKRAELEELSAALVACRAWLNRLADCQCPTLRDCAG